MGVKIIDNKEEVDNNKACQGTSDYLLIKGDLNNDQKRRRQILQTATLTKTEKNS